jgi:chromosome segregation ATPase
MRNKKKALIALGLAMTMPFFAFTFVLASHGEEVEDEGMAPNRLEMRQELQTQMGEAREQMMEKTREQRLMALRALMGAQIRRAENAINRLEALLAKVESRREKLTDEGANLDAVDALIDEAKEESQEAKEALDKAKADYAALDGSETPRQAVQTFMKSMKDLKTHLISLHRTLMATVKAMRQAVPKPDDDADVNTNPDDSQEDTDSGDGDNN